MEQNTKDIFLDFAIQMEKDVNYNKYTDSEIINKWTSRLLSLSNEFRKESQKLSFKEIYSETLLAITNKNEGESLVESIPTGLTDLDRIIGGLTLGELIVLGGRPAMGKSAFLISIMGNILCDKNKPVAYFSMENSTQSIMVRLMSSISELSHHKLVSKPLEDYEINQLADRTKILSEANIYVEDDCYSIDDVIAKTHYLVNEHGVKLIIIDYLQLVQIKGKMNREQEIARVCRELKALARKYHIAVFVCSQLSRAVETRGGDKRPQLSDLRESGAIEQDADKVLFLHRPEYYGITEDENGIDTRGLAEIIVAKNREGFIDSTKIRFLAQFSTFKDLDTFETVWDYSNLDTFKNIRSNEFGESNSSLIRGSQMNDIDEDPF